METTNIEDNKPTLIVKGYEFLRQLCAFNADITSFRGNLNPVSNRVAYIMHQLDAHKIAYTLDKFQPIPTTPDAEENKFAEANVIVEFKGLSENSTTVFTAHHDVNNVESENCQDNTASVANLLDLCVRLSKNQPKNNVVICFNDSEEKVSMTTSGAARMAKQIVEKKYGNVTKIFVLELTANGRNYWMSYNSSQMANKPEIKRVRTPFNDSYTFEKNILPSICIGSLNDGNMQQVATRGFCSTWALCHSKADTFELSANEGDMDTFVNWLETLI